MIKLADNVKITSKTRSEDPFSSAPRKAEVSRAILVKSEKLTVKNYPSTGSGNNLKLHRRCMSLIFICLARTMHQKSAKLINILLLGKRFVL